MMQNEQTNQRIEKVRVLLNHKEFQYILKDFLSNYELHEAAHSLKMELLVLELLEE